jgi:hypothetical protein
MSGAPADRRARMRIDKGLDLDTRDGMTAKEMAAFRAAYENTHGQVLDAYEFWLEHNPRVVKSHRIQARYTADAEGLALPLHGTLGFLHLYTVLAYNPGIAYEVHHSRSLGASKAAVLQTLEIAFIHCGPRGIGTARQASGQLLTQWPDAELDMAPVFPVGWQRDPEAFQIGIDLAQPEMSAAELSAVREWYRRTAGEVPAHVEFLAAGRPGLLKAHLDRMMRAMAGPLPKQMYPFLLLQMFVAQGNPAGIREAALLGRGLGLTTAQLFEAAAWGSMYGGMASLSVARQAAGEVFGVS